MDSAVSAPISVCSSPGEVYRHPLSCPHGLEDFLPLQTKHHMGPAARKGGLVWSGDRPPNPISAYPTIGALETKEILLLKRSPASTGWWPSQAWLSRIEPGVNRAMIPVSSQPTERTRLKSWSEKAPVWGVCMCGHRVPGTEGA